MRKPVSIATIILFILTSFIVILNFVFKISIFQGFFQSLFSTPKSIIYNITRDQKAENAEINRLKNENIELIKKLADYQNLKSDNVALRSQFEETTISPEKLIPAKVVGFLGKFTAPSALIIDKGNENGIKKRMSVVYKKNLVGVIDEVSSNFSIIKLVTHPKFSTVVKIENTTSAGIVTGYNDFILLDHVVITDQIKKGGLVVTKGDIDKAGLGLYPDIIVGKIKSINKTEAKPFQNAQVVPVIDYSRLVEVFIIN